MTMLDVDAETRAELTADRCSSRCELPPIIIRCDLGAGHDDWHEGLYQATRTVLVDTRRSTSGRATTRLDPGDGLTVTWSDAEAMR